CLETRQFFFGSRDNELSTNLVDDTVLLTKIDHRFRALHAEARLQRSGRVVNAGVNNAAIVSALVACDSRLFLDHEQPEFGKRLREVHRGGEADDAPANDDD